MSKGTYELAKVEEVDERQADSVIGSRQFLYIAVCVVNLSAFACGTGFGWTSPVLPKLNSTDNATNPLGEPISLSEASLIGSLLPIGATIGPLAGGYFLDRIGRKNTMLVFSIPLTCGFWLAAYADSVLKFYLVRFLGGFSVGAVLAVLPLYIAEIAEDEIRSSLSSFQQLFIVMGILFSFSIGPYVSIQTFNLLASLFPLAFLFAFYLYVPEAPHYYVSKKQTDLARDSLQKLRGTRYVEPELEEITKSIEEASKRKGSIMDIFTKPGLKKAFIITIGLMALQQFSGINVILFYAQNIFAATGGAIPADIASIIIGVVQVAGSFLTPLLVDKYGKRKLLIISAVCMGISELALGAYFIYKWDIGWLPVGSLIGYILAYCLGAGPLPWAVLGEMFPVDIKSQAATIISMSCWFMSFILTNYFGKVVAAIGLGQSFYIFTGCCFAGAFFVYKCLPDTSGKSLDEIQQILSGGR